MMIQPVVKKRNKLIITVIVAIIILFFVVVESVIASYNPLTKIERKIADCPTCNEEVENFFYSNIRDIKTIVKKQDEDLNSTLLDMLTGNRVNYEYKGLVLSVVPGYDSDLYQIDKLIGLLDQDYGKTYDEVGRLLSYNLPDDNYTGFQEFVNLAKVEDYKYFSNAVTLYKEMELCNVEDLYLVDGVDIDALSKEYLNENLEKEDYVKFAGKADKNNAVRALIKAGKENSDNIELDYKSKVEVLEWEIPEDKQEENQLLYDKFQKLEELNGLKNDNENNIEIETIKEEIDKINEELGLK